MTRLARPSNAWARLLGSCLVRRVSPGIFAVAMLSMAVTAATTGSAAAAPFDPQGEDWEGLSDFVRMAQAELGPHRVVVTSTLDMHALRPEDGVILVHPDRFVDGDELSAFMRAGGRLVLLDDYGAGDGLLTHFGIRRVPLPGVPAEMLRNKPAFAIAEPASDHAVVRGVTRVVTNHATGLEHAALSPVLVVRGNDEPDVLLAVAGAVGRGRLLAVGDASVEINAMLRYAGNRAFCASIIRYATEDHAWGKRDGTLYILTGDFDVRGTFGDDSGVGGRFGNLQRAMTDALEMVRHDGMPPLAAYLLALAVGLGVVAWTSARAGRPHKAVHPRFVRRLAPVAQGGMAGHAAILGAPGTSRVLVVLEMKSALEEELSTRLGLDPPPPQDELVIRVRAAGLLDASHVAALERLLAELARIESQLVVRKRPAMERVRDADVLAVAARVRGLLDAVAAGRP
jgi:hypothetical protein